VRVFWTQPAEAHLAAIHAFLSQTSKRYADRTVDRLTARTKQIGTFPRSGSLVPHAEALEVREIIEGPYRILYVIGAGHIEILGVLHGNREAL
jgi:plasmid stabilization system protein ParE